MFLITDLSLSTSFGIASNFLDWEGDRKAHVLRSDTVTDRRRLGGKIKPHMGLLSLAAQFLLEQQRQPEHSPTPPQEVWPHDGVWELGRRKSWVLMRMRRVSCGEREKP